jgi:futalosine hydrolase
MRLLLVSATHFEISETARWLSSLANPHNAPDAELLISGIGQLETTYSIQKQIQKQRPDLIIQAGIGGGPSNEELCRVYVIGSERMGDLGLMEKSGFKSIFDMGLSQPDNFPFTGGKLVNPYQSLLEWTNLPVTDGITINEIKSADILGSQRNAASVVESMEGAALHYVCLMEKIPFLQIRSVSNVTGERDKSQWKIKEALEILNEKLIFLIQKLADTDEILFRI